MTEFISIEKAAARIGCAPWMVDHAIRNGRLKAQLYGDAQELRTTQQWIGECFGAVRTRS